MIRHYLASALIRFRKSPFTAGANILTLALGLACFIAAYGIATYWSSGDSHHPGADRLVYVCVGCETAVPGQFYSPVPLAERLREDMPELEAVGRVLRGRFAGSEQEVPVSTGETKLFLHVMPSDREILDLFAFAFVEGAAETALRAPSDILLTQGAARRLFGEEPALGRAVRIDGAREATVSGVIAPVRQPSFMGQGEAAPIRFDMITNLSRHIEAEAGRMGIPPPGESWGSVAPATFVRLPPDMTIDAFQARLDDLAERALPRRPDGEPFYAFTAHPISRITSTIIDGRFLQGATAGLTTSAILLGLGGLILAVACVNYANLTAAQARARLKEAGMRKVLGAGRRQLLAQHVLEAGLLTIPALGLALLFLALAAPVFSNLLGVDIVYFLTDGPRGLLMLAAVAGLSATLAAIYPAMTLARVRTADALGEASSAAKTRLVARALVGIQFLSASFLLIVVTVTQLQHAHMRNVMLDSGADPVIVLNDLGATGVSHQTLAAELRTAPQVRSTTAAAHPPWSGGANWFPVALSGEAGVIARMGMNRLVGPDYFETVGLEIIAGRAFDIERDASAVEMFDTSAGAPVPVVIDSRMVQALGLDGPAAALGRTIYQASEWDEPTTRPGRPLGEVVGVVEAIHPQLGQSASGMMLAFDPELERTHIPLVRVDRSDVPGALAAIEQAWDALAPDIPLRASFDEELFEQSYAPFHQIAGVFVVLSACALAISTTGLVGIAVHVVARRRREMGVRKTLGATATSLARLLLVDFSKPILAANLVAWPLGYLAATAYLQPFAERVALTPAPFLFSMALTLGVAWAAVTGEVVKAASVRPADVLRQA